jgi:hypothetical protein
MQRGAGQKSRINLQAIFVSFQRVDRNRPKFPNDFNGDPRYTARKSKENQCAPKNTTRFI